MESFVCYYCKKIFLEYPSNRKSAKTFCSLECSRRVGHVAWNKGKPHLKGERHPMWKGGMPKCVDCGKQLKTYHNRRCKPCSDGDPSRREKLRSTHKNPRPYRVGKPILALRGENNPRWKGGITPIHLQIRHSLEYKQWRTDIFQRDNYTCQFCNQIGGSLQADHWPKTFSQLLRENSIKSLEDALKCKVLFDTKNNRTLCLPCHKLTDTYLSGAVKGANI